jgi:N-acetylneuraminate synthase/N,N'-diacetyllegionaminate synthase
MSYFSTLNNVLIIAEIGVNHNGDVQLAKKLIDAAKRSGADAVKFQTFTAETLALLDTPKVQYQVATTAAHESHFDMLKRLEMSREAHRELAIYCAAAQIEFLSTPYDISSAQFLEYMNVRIFKTASADLVDLPLQRYIASLGKPTIVATGMATLGEIERVVRIYEEADNREVMLLHCVSNYPCSDESLNMRAMNTLADAFALPVGFSDHSEGFLAAVLSVARGAKVIEKHFTLDKGMTGPDHKASSTPEEFADLVSNVRRAERMLGDQRKICQPEEKQMAMVSRKSLVLARPVQIGHVLDLSDMQLRRPGNGIDASYMSALTGKTMRKNCEAGHQLRWSDIEDKP